MPTTSGIQRSSRGDYREVGDPIQSSVSFLKGHRSRELITTGGERKHGSVVSLRERNSGR
jgi:hypothetical protein